MGGSRARDPSNERDLMGVIARYREHLPIGPNTPEVDLHEGSTPLVASRNIARALGLEKLYFKYEGLNPTGSFKVRGMTMVMSPVPARLDAMLAQLGL